MIPPKYLALTADYAVSGHKPPLPPINLRPVWPPPEPQEHWEIQLEEMAAQQRRNEGERIWLVTEQIAQSTNVAGGVAPVRPTRAPEFVEGDTADEVPAEAPVGDLWGIDWASFPMGGGH